MNGTKGEMGLIEGNAKYRGDFYGSWKLFKLFF